MGLQQTETNVSNSFPKGISGSCRKLDKNRTEGALAASSLFHCFQADIQSSVVTHICRKGPVTELQYEGVDSSQSRSMGRWAGDTFGGAYAREVPREALRVLADFPKETRNTYFLPRSMVEPPEALQKQIFPELETYLQKFSDGKIDSEITAVSFLKLLKYLRVVFLQDVVLIKEKYPDLIVFDLPIFSTPGWEEFEKQAKLASGVQESPMDTRLADVMPDLVRLVSNGFAGVQISNNILLQQSKKACDKLEAAHDEVITYHKKSLHDVSALRK